MDEIELLTHKAPYKFVIECRPYLDHSMGDEVNFFTVKLEFEMTNKYPNEAPKFELKHHLEKISG